MCRFRLQCLYSSQKVHFDQSDHTKLHQEPRAICHYQTDEVIRLIVPLQKRMDDGGPKRALVHLCLGRAQETEAPPFDIDHGKGVKTMFFKIITLLD